MKLLAVTFKKSLILEWIKDSKLPTMLRVKTGEWNRSSLKLNSIGCCDSTRSSVLHVCSFILKSSSSSCVHVHHMTPPHRLTAMIWGTRLFLASSHPHHCVNIHRVITLSGQRSLSLRPRRSKIRWSWNKRLGAVFSWRETSCKSSGRDDNPQLSS